MPPSRRAFAAAVAAALAGCARAGPDEDRPDEDPQEGGASRVEPRGGQEVPGPRSGSFEDQFVWWSWVPDITVLNHDTDGVTAYVAVRSPWFRSPLYRTTVSLRGRTNDERLISSSIASVDAPAERSTISVTTADGVSDVHPYHGGNPRRGVSVLLHADHIEFRDVSL